MTWEPKNKLDDEDVDVSDDDDKDRDDEKGKIHLYSVCQCFSTWVPRIIMSIFLIMKATILDTHGISKVQQYKTTIIETILIFYSFLTIN
jgi:hypothetical protein